MLASVFVCVYCNRLYAFIPFQSLSEALVEILENQQRLQQKFHSLTNDNNRSTSIKSDIHTLSVAAQSNLWFNDHVHTCIYMYNYCLFNLSCE